MATGIYRTFMSGRLTEVSVEYLDRTLLCNCRTSISCTGRL